MAKDTHLVLTWDACREVLCPSEALPGEGVRG